METQKLTFEQLPQAVTSLTKEVIELKRLLIEHKEKPTIEQPDQLLTVRDAAELLNLTVPTIYSKVSRGELPVMKQGKRLYFSRDELLDQIKSGRKKSNTEIEAEAEMYLSNNKKGLNNGK